MDYLIFGVIRMLFLPVLVIALVVFIIFLRRRGKSHQAASGSGRYLQFAFSKEDATSQFFILLSFFFLGVTLLALNRDFGAPLSWRTILLVTSLAGLFGSYYLKTIYTLAFSLMGLFIWWSAQAVHWIGDLRVKSSAVLAGLAFLSLLLYLAGHLHHKQDRFKRFALVYIVFGIIGMSAILFFFSTKIGVGLLGEMTRGSSFVNSWQLALSLFIFFASLLGGTVYAISQKLLPPLEVVGILALSVLFLVTALVPQQTMFVNSGDYYYGSTITATGAMWVIIYNFAVFFQLLGIILSGYVRRETWLVNLGALFLFLLIIVKYFDWFFTFLDKSIFFIGAGLLLFVVGWFMEKGRRYMISNIKAQQHAD